MQFQREAKSMELLSPARGFASELQSLEYRRDPLTGSWSRINVSRAGRVRQAQRDEVDVAQLVEDTRAGCFFCPQNIERSTPRFPPALYHAGRITRGECCIFPNLYPFAEYHAVGTLTRWHYLELDEFTAEMLVDNLTASLEYIQLVVGKDAEARYPLWIWNHLPPSGASIVHPHVQILVDRAPMPGLAQLLAMSEQYGSDSGSNYWLDLCHAEREGGERYIGENGSLTAIASFAPRGNREVQFIFNSACNLADLEPVQIMDFADAVVRVLRGYRAMGVNSFNLVTYSAPLGERPPHFRLGARIISRPFFQPLYTGDSGFMERFYDSWVIEAMPEDVARRLRQAWASRPTAD